MAQAVESSYRKPTPGCFLLTRAIQSKWEHPGVGNLAILSNYFAEDRPPASDKSMSTTLATLRTKILGSFKPH